MGVCDGVMGVAGEVGGRKAAEEVAEVGFRKVVREMGWYVQTCCPFFCLSFWLCVG